MPLILQASPSISRINSAILGVEHLIFSPRGAAEHPASYIRGNCLWFLSVLFFFFHRPGAAVVLPLRRGAPVQTVMAIKPQLEVGRALAAAQVSRVESLPFRLISAVGTFAARFSGELGSYMMGLMIG